MELIRTTCFFSYYLLTAENEEFEYADMYVVWNRTPNRIVATLSYDKKD